MALRRVLVLACLTGLARLSFAQLSTNAPPLLPGLASVIVPAHRMPPTGPGRPVPWSPGIPGGIPFYPNCVNVMNYGARGDGVSDDSGAFRIAIGSCTNGGTVYLPAGVYRLNSTILFSAPKQIVVRGAGPAQTRVLSYSSGPAFSFGGDTTRVRVGLTGGTARGSRKLTVNNTAGLSVGNLCRILQSDDPATIFGTLTDNTNPRQMQMFRITAITNNVVTIDNPLYCTYSQPFGPYLEAFSQATTRCGIEDLSINYHGNADNNLFFAVAQQCWVRSVYSSNAVHAHIQAVAGYECVIRDSQTWYHQVYDSDARYGVQLAYSTDCLVENNILQGNNAGVILQYGASGNVIAYNFSDQGFGNGYPTDTGLKGGYSCHGDNANFNLFEGNVAPYYSTDAFWGENRTSTVFRNWWTRFAYVNSTGTPSDRGGTAIYVDATNYWHNIVGNILGTPSDIGDNGLTHYVWEIGYARRAGNEPPAAPADPATLASSCIHGNYDFVTSTTTWCKGASQFLPPSLYLISKPSWFGNLTWPPIGPDVNTSISITNGPVIPAQARYLGITY